MGERKGQSKQIYQISLSILVCLRFVPLVYINTWKESEQDIDRYTHLRVYKEENVEVKNPKSKIKLLQDVRGRTHLVNCLDR